jgi:ferric-dicitrate binding protein FerR (iron transport regulator)
MNQNYSHINDDLLVKYLVGEADANESAEVQHWLDIDENNRKYYNDFQKIWDDSLHVVANKNTVNVDAAWERMQNRMHKTTDVPVRSISKSNSYSWIRIAASFVIIGMITYLGYALFGNRITQEELVATTSVINATLPDGTNVTLNKNSSLAYTSRFEGNTRPVSMKGEVFFNVAHNKQKPFIIKVNDVTVKVVGTSFNVKNRNGKTTVEVETGIVKVSKKSDSVELRKGEKVIIDDMQPELIKGTNKDKLYGYYHDNELVCNETPLQELVDALNEIYDVNIIIEDPVLKEKQINTTFKDQSLGQILNVVSETFRVKVVRKNGQIIIKA